MFSSTWEEDAHKPEEVYKLGPAKQYDVRFWSVLILFVFNFLFRAMPCAQGLLVALSLEKTPRVPGGPFRDPGIEPGQWHARQAPYLLTVLSP